MFYKYKCSSRVCLVNRSNNSYFPNVYIGFQNNVGRCHEYEANRCVFQTVYIISQICFKNLVYFLLITHYLFCCCLFLLSNKNHFSFMDKQRTPKMMKETPAKPIQVTRSFKRRIAINNVNTGPELIKAPTT